MSLRDAKFDDHWRHVYERKYPSRFATITLKDFGCLADSHIQFSGGISAIVGGNGVGKSTLAAAIAELLADSPTAIDLSDQPRLTGSETEAIAFEDDLQRHLRIVTEGGLRVAKGDAYRGNYELLDPSGLASRCLHQIHSDKNFGDLLESVTPSISGPDDLKIASYLVGKNYASVEIFEISDYSGMERFPYFRVTAGGITYTSERMGRGELALLLSHWVLKDLPKNSILIMEEPETHVSPKSQDSLMNIVAKVSVEKAVWVIITTHSPTVVHRIRLEHITLLSRHDGAKTSVAKSTRVNVGLLLGGGVAYGGAVLVEDRFARAFVSALLDKLEPDFIRQFEIVQAGSESDITKVLKSLPRTRNWLTVGVYDGDMRTKIDGEDFIWPYLFLPGDLPPEQFMINLLKMTDRIADQIGLHLNKSPDEIGVALSYVAGADHHDYFRKFSDALNLPVATVIQGLTQIWLSTGENIKAAQNFLDELKGRIADIKRAETNL